MALTHSSMLPLGTKLPTFHLENVLDGIKFDSNSLNNNKNTLVMIICNHCPYVIHYHNEFVRFNNDYGQKMNIVAISSNSISTHPQDGPEHMKKLFNDLGLSFPYLFDETQEVAKSFQAECTPEFYLFNSQQSLVYRGRMDNSSPGNGIEISGKDLREAIDSLFAGNFISNEQYPSRGCNIKWK